MSEVVMDFDKEGFDEMTFASLCKFAGRAAIFDEPYEGIAEGSEVVLWLNEENQNPSEAAYRLRLLSVKAGDIPLEGVEGLPANKMFHAEVLRTTAMRDDEQDYRPYGFLFPDGFAILVDDA